METDADKVSSCLSRPKSNGSDSRKAIESPLKETRSSNFLEWDSNIPFTEFPEEGRFVGDLPSGSKVRNG